MSDDTGGPTPINESSDDVPAVDVMDPNAARRRRRTTWFAVAAVVAAGAVLIGVGGVAIGLVAVGSSPHQTPAQVSFGPPPRNLPALSHLPYPHTSPQRFPYPDGTWLTNSPWPVQFTASAGVTAGGPTSAEAFAYDPAQVNPIAASNSLLQAIGVKPNTRYNVRTATYQGGSGVQSLVVRPNGLLSLTYADGILLQASCLGAIGVPVPGGQPYNGTAPGEASITMGKKPSACTPGKAANVRARVVALALSKKVLRAAGLSTASYRWIGGSASDGQVDVMAIAKVGGQGLVKPLSGLSADWNFTIVDDKVARVAGTLAPVVSLGRYKVIPPKAGVARLNDSTFNSQTGTSSLPWLLPGTGSRRGSTTASKPAARLSGGATAPAAPAPGTNMQWPVTIVTVTKVDLCLAPYVQPNGSVVVMPTYRLTAVQSARSPYYVLAVDSTELDKVTR